MKKYMLVCSLLLSLTASASIIDWYCVPNSYNATSDGTVMGDNFRFELGVFKQGFTPTTENMDQWAENWVPAQRALYNAENNWFTSRFLVTENSADFKPGADAWIWGFAGELENAEWLLARSQNWKWPSANSNSPIPKSWNIANANEVLLGGVGGAFVLQSQRITNALPPSTTWTQWKLENLGEDGTLAGIDLNENGIPDLLEYVQGLDADGNLILRNLSIKTIVDGVELTIPRRQDRPATFNVEYSYDLNKWFPADHLQRNMRSELSQLVLEFPESAEDNNVKYWRYGVVTD